MHVYVLNIRKLMLCELVISIKVRSQSAPPLFVRINILQHAENVPTNEG